MESKQKQDVKQKRAKTPLYVYIMILMVAAGTLILIYQINNNKIVARVNGEIITKEQFYQAALSIGGAEIIEHIISERLILQEGKKYGIAVSEEEIDDELKKVIEWEFLGMEDYFYQTLNDLGIRVEDVRKDLKIDILLRKIILSRFSITEEDSRDYFAVNQEYFNVPAQVDARHILVYSHEEAEEMLRLLNNGADFVDLAREYSEDFGSAEQGGNLGYFAVGEMLPEFEDAAFSLAVGQYSEPVESIYGYHIIEVVDRKDPQEAAFEEVRDQVEEAMLNEIVEEETMGLIYLLWESADIEYRLH